MTAEQDAVILLATERFLLAIQRNLDTYRDAIKATIQAQGATIAPLPLSAPGAPTSQPCEPQTGLSVQVPSAAQTTAESILPPTQHPDPRPGWRKQLSDHQLPGPLYVALCRAANVERGVRSLTSKDIDSIGVDCARYIAVSVHAARREYHG